MNQHYWRQERIEKMKGQASSSLKGGKGGRFKRVALLLCCLWCMSCQTWSEESPLLETKEFATPSMSWRPIPLWFWNNTQVSGNTISQQLQQMIETDGYGGCAILPFGQNFRPSYLSSAFGSTASRMPSPIRLMLMVVMPKIAAVNIHLHQNC